jgi:hypothetical protein
MQKNRMPPTRIERVILSLHTSDTLEILLVSRFRDENAQGQTDPYHWAKEARCMSQTCSG